MVSAEQWGDDACAYVRLLHGGFTPGLWRVTVKGVAGRTGPVDLRAAPPSPGAAAATGPTDAIAKPPASSSTRDAMLELTAANAADYLRRKGWIGPGPVEVEPLGGGVSNAVLRVRTPERVFVLKQSRPQLRTRDAWFSDLDRVYREQEVMQVLHPLLPPQTVPEVLFSDRDEYVFAMSTPRGRARRGRNRCWPATSTWPSASGPAPSSAGCTTPRPATPP